MPAPIAAKAEARSRHLRAILGGAGFGIGLVGAAVAVLAIWNNDASETVYQGLVTETHNALVGGRFRAALLCTTPDKRVSYYAQARSSRSAHEALRWTLPFCELTGLSTQAPQGREQSGILTEWYRGDFNCPANYHRRAVSVSAASLAAAIAQVAAGTPACRIEYVDQTHCALMRPGCQRTGEDFREAGHTAALRGNR